MNRSAILISISLLLLFTIGCKDDPTNSDPNVTIEKEFKILPWETLDDGDRDFHLNVETILTQSCQGTIIDINPTAVGSTVNLTIRNIPEPDCPSPIFPATANFELGKLIPKEYSIQISIKDIVHNQGQLFVTSDYYDIQMETLDGISIPNSRLYKVPQNTIWGYVSYSSIDAEEQADEFLNELNSIAEAKPFLDGYYGYFSMENDKLTVLIEDFPKVLGKTFGLDYDGSNDELIGILENYRSLYPSLVFKIFTSTGEAF